MNKKFIIILMFNICCVYSQQIDSTLHKAYKYKSKILMDEFFMNWKNSNKLSDEEKSKVSETINADDTLKEIYAIMNTFYRGVLGEPMFFISYDTLRYKVCYADSMLGCEIIRDDIMSLYFITPLRIETGYYNELYLNKKYSSTFLDFFKNIYNANDYDDWGKIGEDYDSKRTFLSNYINFSDKASHIKSIFFYMHYLLSKPNIGSIIINKYLNSAIVGYSEGESYYRTLWRKANGNWNYERTITTATW